MRKERNDAQNLIKFISLLAIFSYVIGMLILIKAGNPDLAIRGSITIGIPVILASLLAIIKPIVIPSYDFYNIIETNSNKYIILMSLLFIQMFILSIFVLAVEIERPIAYFLLIALLAGILLVETIFLKLGQNYAKIIVLLEIIFVSLNLCFGVTLNYPFFFGHTDIFNHLNIFRTILTDGSIPSSIGDYYYFPLFHVLNSIFTLFVGLNIQTSYFILSAFLVSFSVILIYLLCLHITKNVNISLLAALLYIFCEPIIYASLYVLPSTTAFFFILLILYLWIAGKRDIRLIMLSIFLILPLTLLHQISSVIFLFLMVLLLIINFYLGDFELLSYKYVILFLLSFLSYWIYLCGPFFEKIVKMILSTRDAVLISNDIITLPIWGVPIRNIDSILMTFITLTSAFIML